MEETESLAARGFGRSPPEDFAATFIARNRKGDDPVACRCAREEVKREGGRPRYTLGPGSAMGQVEVGILDLLDHFPSQHALVDRGAPPIAPV
jgi:hypothetical protein